MASQLQSPTGRRLIMWCPQRQEKATDFAGTRVAAGLTLVSEVSDSCYAATEGVFAQLEVEIGEEQSPNGQRSRASKTS